MCHHESRESFNLEVSIKRKMDANAIQRPQMNALKLDIIRFKFKFLFDVVLTYIRQRIICVYP